MNYAVGDAAAPEARLRDAESLLRLAAGLGRLGAWRVDLPHETVSWSAEVCAIFEVAPDFRCTTAEALDFFVPEDRARLTAAHGACVERGERYDLDLCIVTAQGRTAWVRAIGDPECGPDGAVSGVHGALQDITQARRAADENRQLAERLATSLESLAEVFFILDRQWRFTYVNAEAERIFQRPRGELLGAVIWDLYPEGKQQFHPHYERALATGRMVEFEAHYAPLDHAVQIHAYPSTLGLAVSGRDITARRRAEQQVLRLNSELEARVLARTEELRAANEELEAFSYSIAHDLRGPMNAISAFALVLGEIDGDQLSPRGLSYLNRICAAARQLDAMSDSLLALARLSKAALARKRVDLSALALDILEGLRERQPGRAVQVQVAPGLHDHVDPVLMRQVLENLLGNAWKFTARAESARVEFGAVQPAAQPPVFFVRDNGAGFDMAYAGRLYQPFGRLHSERDFPGNGVGLAIVHKILHRHDGRIWAESAESVGTTFFFTFGPGAAAA
jgi:PAS domain S-box-containing protein